MSESYLIERGLPCTLGCSSSNAMSEYSDHWYCYACGTPKDKKIKTRSIQEKEVRGASKDQTYHELPDKARAFLYKFHFTDELIQKYSICYAYDFKVWSTRKQSYFNSGDRVILPSWKGQTEWFCEARTLDKDNDLKYVTLGGKQLIFKTFSDGLKQPLVVLVEDLLSGIRVGEVCNAVALRGTSFNDDKLCQILDSGKDFIVWLDSDKPGQDAAKTLIHKLNWWGGTVKAVISDRDPKCYSDEEIRRFLENAQ